MSDSSKLNFMLFAIFAGMLFWGSLGHEYVTDSIEFKGLVKPLIGHGLFSLKGLMFGSIFISVYFYPMFLWMLFCSEVLERGSTKEFFSSGGVLYFCLIPFMFIIFIGIFVALFVVRTLLVVIVFVVLPLYFISGSLYDLAKGVRKKS